MRLWYLSHRRPVKAWAQSRQSLRCSPTWSMEVDEGSDQKSDIWPHWMAAHARLKNELTEDEKYHNLMSCLICHLLFLSTFSANLNPFFFQKYPKIEWKEWHWKEWHLLNLLVSYFNMIFNLLLLQSTYRFVVMNFPSSHRILMRVSHLDGFI